MNRFVGNVLNTAVKFTTRSNGVQQNMARSFMRTSKSHMQDVRPSDLEKRLLVKAKMYKSIDEIPEKISYAKMKKAHEYTRMRVASYMIIGTVVICMMTIYYGKNLRDSGDSLTKRGNEWQREMRAQGIREEEERKKAAGN